MSEGVFPAGSWGTNEPVGTFLSYELEKWKTPGGDVRTNLVEIGLLSARGFEATVQPSVC